MRRALAARLTDEAIGAWHAYAESVGVSVTGVLEALGPHLAAGGKLPPTVLEAARRVDHERRRRR